MELGRGKLKKIVTPLSKTDREGFFFARLKDGTATTFNYDEVSQVLDSEFIGLPTYDQFEGGVKV